VSDEGGAEAPAAAGRVHRDLLDEQVSVGLRQPQPGDQVGLSGAGAVDDGDAAPVDRPDEIGDGGRFVVGDGGQPDRPERFTGPAFQVADGRDVGGGGGAEQR
jgi:hypothetical protein